MENQNEIYRTLFREALLEAGYHRQLSPWMQDVVLATADELYLERLEEEYDESNKEMSQLAQRWLPSLAA